VDVREATAAAMRCAAGVGPVLRPREVETR
jgi:hypothetical protein